MKKYIIEIPEKDMTKITNSGYISRTGNYVRFYDRIDSPLLKEYEDSESRDPRPGEEWEFDEDELCVIIKEIEGWDNEENTYDAILNENGECENFTREELIRPTGRTYPKIIEAIKEYLDEDNNQK